MTLKSFAVASFTALWADATAEERKAVAAIVAAEHGLVKATPWWALAIDGLGLIAVGFAIGHWLV